MTLAKSQAFPKTRLVFEEAGCFDEGIRRMRAQLTALERGFTTVGGICIRPGLAGHMTKHLTPVCTRKAFSTRLSGSDKPAR